MDELDLLNRALPDARPPSPAVVARARARVAAGAEPARKVRRPWGRSWALWAAPATAGIVGVVFALVANLAPAPVAVRPADPRQALLDLADRVERLPAEEGAYWRQTVTTGHRMRAGTYTVQVTSEADYWHPRDGGDPALARWTMPAARPGSPADERAWRAAGSPGRVTPDCPSGSATLECKAVPVAGKARPGCVYTWGVRRENVLPEEPEDGVTLADLDALPTGPDKLDAYLRDQHRALERRGTSQPVETYVLSTAMRLLSQPLRPGQRAAVLRLLAAHPYTVVGGTVMDPLGRKGLSLTFTNREGLKVNWYAQGRSTLVPTITRYVIDPGTGVALGTVDTANAGAPGLPKGAVIVYGAVEGGWTDERPDRPGNCSVRR
ncbi:CU044_5270 family protein [Nonomuraea sp. NPDC050202]|uniref:CU044_5270 family protein n=1 Tax=Nonomuraea sp. NPDC050202 TaxID=3155035 RepID=UPI0033E3CAE6